ncbi:MAG: phenylalanine--tRNA ligase subunit beta [Hyphomonadaceae bacterium]|nr:phenylalanine--tRNA ligase subunit beta [Hyphomonadaceae bacterium]MBC6413279.1 phenylalanine--tRNA ligase subunit beta [Hyphomonadaceae bacterium]
MKFSLSWLKDHLETRATTDQVVEAMTLAGLEVEDVEDPVMKLADFTVAHVVHTEKHPDADKLSVCTVETSEGTKQIVCGAPNARAGIAVAYAPPGTYIPGSKFSLDKTPRKIRGIESYGMMCSAKELELGDGHDSVLELDPSQHAVGQPVPEAVGANDPVIDFEVTPNRPDWLGVNSIARDLAAAGLGTLKTPAIQPVQSTFENPQTVRIKADDACPAFVGRVIKGVKNGPSPDWLQTRLKAIGLRPISALVDIANFITFDRARPLHFYDRAKLRGDIIVRYGQNETFDALDNKNYTATEQDCVICDESGILGLGGIVGGRTTSCDENTTEILIECAYFDPKTIRRSAVRLGVNSDAKYRFERGVDTGFLPEGIELATRAVLDICGGAASHVVVAGDIPAPPPSLDFDPMLINRLTGLSLPGYQVEKILTDLGFRVTAGHTWTIDVPSWRRDVTEGVDLIEEIVRIAGYHNLEAVSLPAASGCLKPTATLIQNRTRLARRVLAGRGLSEAITWSFVLQDHAKVFDGGAENMRLDNPISSDLDCMRPSALIHLLLAGQRNADRGYPGSTLFELGPVYHGTEPDDQALALAGIRRVETIRDWAGNILPDALTTKADALAALSVMGANVDNFQTTKPTGDYWHPGRSGRLQMGPENILADFGELHPHALKALGIDGRVVAFEIWPENLPTSDRKRASKAKGVLELSDFMPVHKDFAFVVKKSKPAGDIIKAAKSADKQLISDVTLFDVYEGWGIKDGYKSLAIDVALTPKDATLTEKDIDALTKKIIMRVRKAGGELRS